MPYARNSEMVCHLLLGQLRALVLHFQDRGVFDTAPTNYQDQPVHTLPLEQDELGLGVDPHEDCRSAAQLASQLAP